MKSIEQFMNDFRITLLKIKNVVFLCHFILLSNFSFSQINLITNPSIEGDQALVSSPCVTVRPSGQVAQGDLEIMWLDVIGWQPLEKGSDLFGFQWNQAHSTPDRLCNLNEANSGSGYIHFTSFGDNNNAPNDYEEVICQNLNSPLIPGKQYYIEYFAKVSNGGQAPGYLNAYLSLNRLTQTKNYKLKGNYEKILIDEGLQDSYNRFSKWFIASSNYSWLTFASEPDAPTNQVNNCMIDDVSLFMISEDGCPNNDLYLTDRQFGNIHAVMKGEQQLIAGSSIFANIGGDVDVLPQEFVVFQASDAVILKEGFTAHSGSHFLARLADCNADPCEPIGGFHSSSFNICNSNTAPINTVETNTNLTYSWFPTTFLSSSNIRNPTFNVPAGSHGTITYNVDVMNDCGQATQEQVVVKYSNPVNQTPNNSITINSQNDHEIDFDLTFDIEAEFLTLKLFEVTSGGNSLVHSVIYERGLDFSGTSISNLTFIRPSLINNQILSVCNDYLIEVTSENYCSSSIATSSISWPKTTKNLNLIHIDNVITPNGDGTNDVVMMEVEGADYYSLDIYDRRNVLEKSYSGSVVSGPFSTWNGTNGSGNIVKDGVYFYVLFISDYCGNSASFSGSITKL